MIKILVVDNDARTLYDLVRRLDRDGLDVHYESTGEMAIASLTTDSYDVCLFNTMLPDMSGFDLLAATLEITPSMKVIMMTASLVNENIRLAMEQGAYYFITKPVSPRYFRKIVDRAVCSKFDCVGDGATKREFARQPLNDGISFSLSLVSKRSDGSTYLGAKCRIKARTIDLSEGGVGVISRFSLEKNQSIIFHNNLQDRSGIVKWCTSLGDKSYRVGIQFV